jgi:serine protease Do
MSRAQVFIVGIIFFIACCAGAAGTSYLVAKHIANKPNGTLSASLERSRSTTSSLASHSSSNTLGQNLITQVEPAVVDITSDSQTYSFFGGPIIEESAGTGMIVSSNGYILTNNHVLPLNSQDITVTTSTGKQYSASVVGTNPTQDLALIKINASGLPTVPLGDSSKVQVGDSVIAIGNALGQYANTVDQGIVSGLNRSVEASDDTILGNSESLSGMLQTDALINPGDSGGPLIDVNTGSVVGMDTAVASNSQGIGFAIPINNAKTFLAKYNL